MKTRILKILIPVLIIAFAAAYGLSNKLPPTAFAVGDLTVNWGVPEGDPIFTISNMSPGQTQTHEVHIDNSSTSPRDVAVRGVLTTDPDNLASVLNITITRGVDIYSGTLSQFFTDSNSESGISLFTLNSGENTDITFVVTFSPTAGNEFQGKSITFDIKIGIGFDLPADCQAINFTGPVIFGTSRKDNLRGSNESEIILAFEGNDEIRGGKGADCIIAGPGKDRIRGGDDGDVIFGDEGDDKIDGNKGADIIHGGPGKDHIVGGDGNDQIFGDGDDDSLHGDKGLDIIHGGSGNDLIEGGEGNDQVFGEEGNDDLDGNSGNDHLDGGPGTDKVNGGNGDDTCTQAEIRRSCTLV